MLTLKSMMTYLKEKQLATVDTIAGVFQVERSLVEHMLDRLIKNGCVVCMTTKQACGSGCGDCALSCREVYRWL